MKMLQLAEDEDDTDHIPSSSSFFKIHHEAIIMERLTASPTIVNIYGHCATSISAEIMPQEVTTKIVPLPGYITQTELDQRPTLCQNNLTLDEKLEIAIVMAESMAEMHGFVGGPMVHGDIHPGKDTLLGGTADRFLLLAPVLTFFTRSILARCARESQA